MEGEGSQSHKQKSEIRMGHQVAQSESDLLFKDKMLSMILMASIILGGHASALRQAMGTPKCSNSFEFIIACLLLGRQLK